MWNSDNTFFTNDFHYANVFLYESGRWSRNCRREDSSWLMCEDDAGSPETAEHERSSCFFVRGFEHGAVWCSLRNWGKKCSLSFGAGDVETGEWRRFWEWRTMCKDAVWMRNCRVWRMCNWTLTARRTILREEQFVVVGWSLFSVVFLKMDFVLVRSNVRAKASRPKLFHVVSVFGTWRWRWNSIFWCP